MVEPDSCARCCCLQHRRALKAEPTAHLMAPYDALVQQLHSGSPSEQHQAVAALSVLPFTPRNWLSAVGTIPCLVQLMHSASTTDPQVEAIWNLLQDISESRQYAEEEDASGLKVVAPDGLIPPLVLLLLHPDDADVQQVAAQTLSTLATNADNRQKILEAGAIAPLIQLLKSCSEDLHHPAADALGFITENRDAQSSIVAAGGIVPLLQLLSGSSNVEVQWSAVVAVRFLANDHADPIVAAGAIPLLVRLLESSATGVQEEAALALGSLARNVNTNVDQMVTAGAIPLLVGLLKTSGSCVMQRWAARALGNLALGATCKIIAAGAVEPLVNLLKSNSAYTQSAAARALVNLSGRNKAGQARIVAAGAIAPLIRLLHAASSDELQGYAVMILFNLASSDANIHFSNTGSPTFHEQIVDAGAIRPLVHILRSASAIVHERAVCLLALLAANGRSCYFAPNERAGALPLLAHLQTAASSEAARNSAKTLLLDLSTGKLPFEDPGKCSSSALSSATVSAPPASAAGSSSTAAVVSPPAATSPQQQQQQPPRLRKSCWSCGAKGVPLKKCSVCAVAAYCCAGCQKADWKAHKGQCVGLKAGASGSGCLSAAGEK